MDIIYHFPPELTQLLIDTVPLLARSKKDVLLFFKGAGIEKSIYHDIEKKVSFDKDSINKYEITREILKRLNELGEKTLRERREILKRVTEYEDFSTCWPDDQLKAKGLVAEIRRVVNVKDSFTRMKQEKDAEQKKKSADYEAKVKSEQERTRQIDQVKTDLFALFGEQSPQVRGKKLEGVLNSMFNSFGILIREAFGLVKSEGSGITEQIDGVIELDGEIYLVEMKWHAEPIGVPEISSHLIRVYHRGYTRGIFISATGYTGPAISVATESLQKTVFILSTLQEFVFLLEKKADLKGLLREKIRAAAIEKKPFKETLS